MTFPITVDGEVFTADSHAGLGHLTAYPAVCNAIGRVGVKVEAARVEITQISVSVEDARVEAVGASQQSVLSATSAASAALDAATALDAIRVLVDQVTEATGLPPPEYQNRFLIVRDDNGTNKYVIDTIQESDLDGIVDMSLIHYFNGAI